MARSISEFQIFNNQTNVIKESIKLFYIFEDRDEKTYTINDYFNVIIVTGKDEIKAFGRNSYGCLGFTHNKAVGSATLHKYLFGKRLIKFYNGFFHVLAKNDQNELFYWGYNNVGQLGIEADNQRFFAPQKHEILSNKDIVDISCGPWHSLAMTSNGEVYAWGDNKFGQIGNGLNVPYVTKPFRLHGSNAFLGHKIIAISCGSKHSLALSQDYRVFSWGSNESGQLGHQKSKISNKPTLIEIYDVNFAKICCGLNVSYFLTSDGYIYVYGKSSIDEGKKYQKVKGEYHISHISFKEIASERNREYLIAISEDERCYEVLKREAPTTGEFYEETEYESFVDYYAEVYKITYKTIENADYKGNDPTASSIEQLENSKVTTSNTLSSRLIDNQKAETLPSVDTNKGMNLLKENPILDSIQTSLSTNSNRALNSSFEKTSSYGQYFKNWELIGKGGFGSVYKVLHKMDEQIYAVKKITPEDLEMLSEVNIRDFVNSKFSKELRLLAKLKSNFIVQYKCCWIEDNAIFIQMEYCLSSLDKIIQLKPKQFKRNDSELMSKAEYFISCEFFKEILEGINYLHKQDPPIIHRDLKPTNILISDGSDGSFVKIADFGLATFHKEEDQTHTKYLGTKNYQAPDVKNKSYDTKADIWSLGLVTQEIFDIDINSSKLPALIKNSELKYEYGSISDLIEKMMSPRTTSRPTCEQILSDHMGWNLNKQDLKNDSKFIQMSKMFSQKVTMEEGFFIYFLRVKLG